MMIGPLSAQQMKLIQSKKKAEPKVDVDPGVALPVVERPEDLSLPVIESPVEAEPPGVEPPTETPDEE